LAATFTAVSMTITPASVALFVQPLSSRAGVAIGGAEPSMPGGLAVAALGTCYTGLKVKGTELCTHGPDPVPDWIRKRGGPRLVQPTAVGASAAVACDGDGTSGKRVQALYVYIDGRPNRLSNYRTSMNGWAAYVDSMFDNSARETGGRARLRWVTRDCALDVAPAKVSAAAEVDFGVMVSELNALGFSRTDRKYLLWFDSDPQRAAGCGMGTIWGDDQPGPANQNNNQTGYARIDWQCWDFAESHELMHNLGGVQLSAPHSSGGWHCTDENDQMCYADGTSIPLTYPCADSAHSNIFDCRHDDYFHTSPAANSYLATHWNTARSDWVVGGEEAATVLPPVVGKPSAALLAGQTMTSTVRAQISWAPPADTSGVAAYQLQRRKGTGSWINIALAQPLATTADVLLAIGSSYTFRVRAVDANALGGPWTSGATATIRRFEETAANVTYQSGFKRRALTGASADHVRKGSTANRLAALKFTGTTVAFVSTSSSARGIVRLRVDGGEWQEVDLFGVSTLKKRVVWAASLAPGSHTLQLAAAGARNDASTSNRIDIDAFLVR
jgi:hypothetical protein